MPKNFQSKSNVKLTPYSRGTTIKIAVERARLANNADNARRDREIKREITQQKRKRAIDAQFLGRGHKPSFDWEAFKRRPKYVPAVGAPGFNHF